MDQTSFFKISFQIKERKHTRSNIWNSQNNCQTIIGHAYTIRLLQRSPGESIRLVGYIFQKKWLFLFIKFNDTVSWLLPCSDSLMPATTRNKRLIYQALDQIVPLGKASFANALNFTYHLIVEVRSRFHCFDMLNILFCRILWTVGRKSNQQINWLGQQQ